MISNLKKHKTIILTIFLLLLMFFFYGLAVETLSKVKQVNHYSTLTAESASAAYTGEQAYQVWQTNEKKEDDQLTFAIWGSQGVELITSPDLQTSMNAEVIALCGNSQILFPNTPPIYANETKLCLISKKMAAKLFGSTEVKGVTINYQNQEYTVAGVIDTQEALLVFQTTSAEVTNLSQVTLMHQAGTAALKTVKQFENSTSFQGQLLDYLFLAFLSKLFFLLLPAILLATAFFSLKKAGFTSGFILFLISSFILFYFFTRLPNFLSLNWLPDNWSDFRFFVTLGEKEWDSFGKLTSIWQTPAEKMYLRNMGASLLYNGLAIVVFFLLRKKVKQQKCEGIKIAYSFSGGR